MADQDNYNQFGPNLNAPGIDGAVIVPSDSADLAVIPRAILICAAGTIQVTTLMGTVIPIPYIGVGTFSMRVKRIWATNTNIPAGNIISMW